MPVSPGTWSAVAGAVLTANRPDAIRIGVMLPRAAAYGFARAVIGVRMCR